MSHRLLLLRQCARNCCDRPARPGQPPIASCWPAIQLQQSAMRSLPIARQCCQWTTTTTMNKRTRTTTTTTPATLRQMPMTSPSNHSHLPLISSYPPLRNLSTTCTTTAAVLLPPSSSQRSSSLLPPMRRHQSTRHSDPSVPPTTLAQYLDLLRADVNKLRRVHGATLSAALDQARFSPAGRDCSTADALFLLQCCSLLPEKPRPEKLALIEQAWPLVLRGCGDMDETSAATAAQPTGEHLVALLREYRTNMKKLNFGQFFELYGEAIEAGGLPVYVALLYLAAEIGDEAAMVRVLQAIRDGGMLPSEDVFNALILGHSRCRQLIKCEQVLDAMRAAGVEPNPRTYKELIRAYIENRAPDRAERMLAERGAELTVPQVLSVIRTAIRRDDQSQVLRMAFERLPDEILGNRHIIPEIRNACVELVQANEARKAFRIIEQLPVPKFSENEDSDGFATFFISELIRSGTPQEEVAEMARQLVDAGRNTRALHVCCEVALRHNSPDALLYLQELARLEPLRAHYFWPLLVREHQAHGEAGVLNVLRDMNALDVLADYETLSQYVLPRLPITLSELLRGCKELEERGVRMTQLVAPLVALLVQQNRLGDGVQLIETYTSRLNAQTLLWPLVNYARNARHQGAAEVASLAKILGAIARKNSAETDLTGQVVLELISNPTKRLPFEVLLRMLQQFRANDVHMSKFSGEVVGQYMSKCGDEEQRKTAAELLEVVCDKRLNEERLDLNDEHIRHPRDMSLEELECHLVELQSKGANTRGVLRRLLQQNVRAGKLERALEVHAECQRHAVSLSAGMVAAVMELMTRTGNLPAAQSALRQLHELFPAFNVDEHKIVDLAALLVQEQKVETAKELLRRRAAAGPIKGGTGIQKNVWQLLTNAATLSADPLWPLQAKPLFEFLLQLGYCEPQNNVLGPQIRECLHKGQLRDAVAEFLDVARLYRRTPLQFELLSQLIAATNGVESAANSAPEPLTTAEAKQLLQQVIETATLCHGAVNVNVSLVVAFAHSGTEGQLRKILIDPAVRVNMPAILKQCEYLCESGAVEPLLRLAKCSRGLSGDVKEADFYGMLMGQYVRQNDCEKAMGLFERLVADDDFKVTAELTRTLIGLLERNNLEVPSSVLMYWRG